MSWMSASDYNQLVFKQHTYNMLGERISIISHHDPYEMVHDGRVLMDLRTFALTLRNKHGLQIIAGFDRSPGPEKSSHAKLHLHFPTDKNFDQIVDHCHRGNS